MARHRASSLPYLARRVRRRGPGKRTVGDGGTAPRSDPTDLRDLRPAKAGRGVRLLRGPRLPPAARRRGRMGRRGALPPPGRQRPLRAGRGGFIAEAVARVRAAGATGEITLRADSGFYARSVVESCRRAKVGFSITAKLHKAVVRTIEAIPEEAWVPIPYFLDGADVAETTYTPFGRRGRPVRLIVRRVRPTPGTQLHLIVPYTFHGFITDRDGDTLELEADHRRHAEVENTVRDLKYGVGLNHLPSGRFGANAAWLGLQVIAHNLARWVSRIGLGDTLVATKTLRVRHLSVPGRLTRSGRRRLLHLPRAWPWAEGFLAGLDRLRAIPVGAPG